MRKLLFGLVVTGTVLAAACGAAATPTSNPNSHGAQRRHATAGGSHIRARCHSYPDAGTCRHRHPKAHGHFHTGSNGHPHTGPNCHDGSRACPNGGARCRGARYHGAGADPDIGTHSYQRSSANTNSPTNLDSCTHRNSRSQSNPLSDGHTARACPRYQSGGHNGTVQVSPRQHHCRSRRYSELDRYRYRAHHYIGSVGRRDRDMGQWLQESGRVFRLYLRGRRGIPLFLQYSPNHEGKGHCRGQRAGLHF